MAAAANDPGAASGVLLSLPGSFASLTMATRAAS